MDKIIGIGGSLGSLEELKSILKELPKSCETPLIYVFHQRTANSKIITDLNKISHYDVVLVKNGVTPQKKTLYISLPDFHVLFSVNGKFILSQKEAIDYTRPSINLFFKTASHVYKENLLLIILSGSNKDGAIEALRSIKKGTSVAVISPENSISPRMPLSILNLDESLKSNSIKSLISIISNWD
jgi:two-component system chemotaxis response regulator CheB